MPCIGLTNGADSLATKFFCALAASQPVISSWAHKYCMDTYNNQPELVSQQCIDRWRDIYANYRMLRQSPYWAYDRQGIRIPITSIVNSVNPQRILDYGSGNGYAANLLRIRNLTDWIDVVCYDPAWPGSEQVPTGQFDMVIAYNVLNNVEVPYRARVCSHIESLVGRDLILAIQVPRSGNHPTLINDWIKLFPGLLVSYSSISIPEEMVGLKGQPISAPTLFIWLYRAPAEVIPVEPRVRVKKKGT